MKTIIPLVAIASLLTACVAPVPLNTNTTALYPGYFPVYTPQIAIRTPVISAIPVPVASVAIKRPANIAVAGTQRPPPQAWKAPAPTAAVPVKAPVVTAPQAVPVAYTRNIPAATPIQPRALKVPTLSPVSNKRRTVAQPIPQAQPYTAVNRTVAIPKTSANIPTTIPAINNTQHRTQDLNWLAQRIFRNQTGGDTSRLVRWNERENFTTLGIGQFIWYPAGKRGRYQETFPTYLNYVKANGVPLPAWLAQRPQQGSPWTSTSAFQRTQNDSQMRELRNFLQKTLSLQANFMAARLKQTTPGMINQLPQNARQKALRSYQTLLKSPGSLYPMLDYVQFQGTGTNPAERYNGTGWGLLQVLQNMEQVQPGSGALAEFMRAADDTLVTRIANAPAERREARLLNGWLARVNTYRPPRRASR